MLTNEMVHNARVVPLDAQPTPNVRQWNGTRAAAGRATRWSSRRRASRTRRRCAGSSPNLHLVERFTRTDADTLIYEFTVNDPTTWTRPWTAEIPMPQTDEQIYEYACHEANYGMTNLLKGARYLEKEGGAPTTTTTRQP